MGAPWPEAAIDSLRRHWAAKQLSASQIAAELWREHRFSVSRNGVVGKVHRLGLEARRAGVWPKAAKVERKGKPKRWLEVRPGRKSSRGGEVREIEIPFVDLPPDTSPDACTLLELRENSCRYPMGDVGTEAFRFCGTEQLNGHSYCPRHCRIVYRPARLDA